MNFLQYLLLEDRTDYIAQQMGSKIMKRYKEDNGLKPDFEKPLQIVKYLAKCHPSYIQWIVKQYVEGRFKLEDRTKIKSELEEFDRIKPQLGQKDINEYKTLKDLYNIVDTFNGKEVVSARQVARDIKGKGADKLVDNAEVLMYKIKTKEAAMLLGKGTRWCTASTNDNMFDYYDDRGPLFVIINKEDNEKYQLHLSTSSCMDAEDNQCNIHNIFSDSTLTEIMSALVQQDARNILRFLHEYDNLVNYLKEEDLLKIIKFDVYGNFIYEIPIEKRTKPICLAAFDKNSNAYSGFPDKFKTLALSIEYYKDHLHLSLEAIPKEHMDAVKQYYKQMNDMKAGIRSWKNAKKFNNTIQKHGTPDQRQNPETAGIFKDAEADVSKTKQHLAGFKDYVKQLRQQKREMAAA